MKVTKKQLLFATVTGSVLVLAIIIFFVANSTNGSRLTKPHIVIIIADDLGYNDVGFHGSNQIPTPNLDALAYNGIIMDRFYTQSICTPSRAAFLTGNYPIRSGMQGYPLMAGENRSLPFDMPTMPEQLKKLGYKTHLVGKWHLGAAYRSTTPTGRGFDTHFGYWNGFVGYYDYISMGKLSNNTLSKGFDLHDNFKAVWSCQGKYATERFTDKSLEIIDKHNVEEPLFMVVAHLAAHTGKNGTELEVPDVELTQTQYSYVEDKQRRNYAGVVNFLDDSVGRIVAKLQQKQLLDNSVVLFFSDNGAQTVGMYENSGSNWPLRGLKFTEFEGGVRTAAALYSPLLKTKGYVSKDIIHLVDWLPTFYSLAGGDLKDLGPIDGINQWSTLSHSQPTKRSEILLNINEVNNTRAIISDFGRFKLLEGTYSDGYYDRHYGDSGRGVMVPPYNISAVLTSRSNVAIAKVEDKTITEDTIGRVRQSASLSCKDCGTTLNCTKGCLFDLENDPCECNNLMEQVPEVAKRLYGRLEYFTKVSVKQKNQKPDPAANPGLYNNTWCTWLDDEICTKTKHE